MSHRSIGQERFGLSGSRSSGSLDELGGLIDWASVALRLDSLYRLPKAGLPGLRSQCSGTARKNKLSELWADIFQILSRHVRSWMPVTRAPCYSASLGCNEKAIRPVEGFEELELGAVMHQRVLQWGRRRGLRVLRGARGSATIASCRSRQWLRRTTRRTAGSVTSRAEDAMLERLVRRCTSLRRTSNHRRREQNELCYASELGCCPTS